LRRTPEAMEKVRACGLELSRDEVGQAGANAARKGMWVVSGRKRIHRAVTSNRAYQRVGGEFQYHAASASCVGFCAGATASWGCCLRPAGEFIWKFRYLARVQGFRSQSETSGPYRERPPWEAGILSGRQNLVPFQQLPILPYLTETIRKRLLYPHPLYICLRDRSPRI
jgi:hypothetical protein